MSSTVAGVLPFEYAQLGSAPSPLEYPLPASVVVQLTAATATFDGTGAAGSFLACLSFYDQAGNKIVRVFPQTPVPAGEVADVNYAPFPGGLINNNAGATVTSGWYYPSGGSLTIQPSPPGTGTASPVFQGNLQSGTELFNYTANPGLLTPLFSGLYVFTFTWNWVEAAVGAGAPYSALNLTMQGADIPFFNVFEASFPLVTAASPDLGTLAQATLAAGVYVTPNDTLDFVMTNADSNPQTFNINLCQVACVGP